MSENELNVVDVRANLPRVTGWSIMALLGTATVFLGALFLAGWKPHVAKLAAADSAARASGTAKPVVETVVPRVGASTEQLSLPADVRPNQSTALFARTGGYLKTLPPHVDIGSLVTAGQLLAEIDAPELDAQWAQAQATVEQSLATVGRLEQEQELAASTLRRYEAASGGEAVGPQEMDERRVRVRTAAAAVVEARSAVAVAQAALKRLTEQRGFLRITAPFAGVITARGFDAGALIVAGDGGGGKELFRLEDASIMRAQVNVPQNWASDVRVGQDAQLTVRNDPTRVFKGKIARSTGSIDGTTRTLRVEIDIPNPDRALLSGMYGQAKLECHREHAPVLVPAGTLMIGAEGVRLAVVDGGKVKFKTVSLGRDFGTEVEILSGIEASDAIVNNPAGLSDGVEVTVRERPAAPK